MSPQTASVKKQEIDSRDGIEPAIRRAPQLLALANIYSFAAHTAAWRCTHIHTHIHTPYKRVHPFTRVLETICTWPARPFSQQFTVQRHACACAQDALDSCLAAGTAIQVHLASGVAPDRVQRRPCTWTVHNQNHEGARSKILKAAHPTRDGRFKTAYAGKNCRAAVTARNVRESPLPADQAMQFASTPDTRGSIARRGH